jgi:hypothetical protein
LEPRDEFLKQKQSRKSVERRREERELLFWTIRQTCLVALLGAATVCAVISLALGEVGGSNLVGQLLAGAGRFFG